MSKRAAIHVLMSGDLHIGRSSSRVPDTVRRDDLRAAAAWERLVNLAIERQVHLVCLSGDVADQDNKFWEAIGPLEAGIKRLGESGILTVAVAGNHDFDVLARLADQLEDKQFTLLGRNDQWERLTIEKDGRPILHVDGWSFPSQQVHHSPLDSYDLARDASVPTLGIVHGDLDVANSRYAPLQFGRLRALPVSGWLLGHVHAPRLIEGPPWVLYPGSPQALDPGETGRHGPWLATIADGTLHAPEQLPLSSVWYGKRDVDVSDAVDETALESKLLEGLRASAELAAQEAGTDLLHASLRLRLVGATPAAHLVAGVVDRLTADVSLEAGAGTLGIDKVDVQITPAVKLGEHAEATSVLGSLARMLLELDLPEPSSEVAQLVRDARNASEQIEQAREFTQLARREVTEQMARERLRTQGRALLTHLLLEQS